MLRGGAFKPRTSPYKFQGHGEEALKMLAAAREETGLAVVTEVLDVRDLDLVVRRTAHVIDFTPISIALISAWVQGMLGEPSSGSERKIVQLTSERRVLLGRAMVGLSACRP